MYNQEALRLVKTMPEWIPAEDINGYCESICELTIPFDYRNRQLSDIKLIFDNNEWDVLPEFYGGRDALKAYLQNSINKDVYGLTNARGKVVVQFTLDGNGRVAKAEVVKSVHPEFNEEALRIINSMPRWKVGQKRGRPANWEYQLPIYFSGKVSTSKSTNRVQMIDESLVMPVDLQPEFPGGRSELQRYIDTHLHVPLVVSNGLVSGRVMVSFIIEEDGSLSDIGVMKSVQKSLDEEALRVVKNMPKWIPAQRNGANTRYMGQVIIVFKDSKELNSSEGMFTDPIYVTPSEGAQFPGGEDALLSYLDDNIQYSKSMLHTGSNCTVVVSFIVDRNGCLHEFEVVDGLYPEFNTEALRVVKEMPQWIPAKVRSKSVNVKYSLPIEFRL